MTQREDWLATHGPGLVIVFALLAITLLTGAADQPGDSWLSTGGIGAVIGAVLTWASTYRARQAQAQRVEARAHDGAYHALGSVIDGLRAEIEALQRDLAAARVEAAASGAELARLRGELERAQARLARVTERERWIADAVVTLDERTRSLGPSVTPTEGIEALEISAPGREGPVGSDT